MGKLGLALGVVLPGGKFNLKSVSMEGRGKVKAFKKIPFSLLEMYRTIFNKFSKKAWLKYEGDSFTYAEVLETIEGMGVMLQEKFDVKRGDRVGIAMRNYPEFMMGFLAATAMGAVAVPLNALWKTEELQYAVKDSACKVLFVDEARLGVCAPFLDELGTKTVLVRPEDKAKNPVDRKPDAIWGDLVKEGKGKKLELAMDGKKKRNTQEDEGMIMYTSGSTGFPKGVCHYVRAVMMGIKMGELIAAANPDPAHISLLAVPLFHITALGPVVLCSMPVGGTIIMMYKWDAGKALDIIEKEKVSRFTGVPTMVRDILEHPDFTEERIKTIKGMISGGAPTPESQIKKMNEKAKKVKGGQGYGLTETFAFATAIVGKDQKKHPKSCGKPIPLLIDIKIKDPETGKVVKNGQRGEVCIKSAMIMKCYYNKPEATAKAIDKDGYFHSGDIGKLEGGFLYLLDRIKDIIIRGGENIDTSEVEHALQEHKAVRECSVFALPDERLGEIVGAAVWATDKVTGEELVKELQKHLASFKIPKAEHIFFHSEPLPKGATGKIDKKGMRDHYTKVVKGEIEPEDKSGKKSGASSKKSSRRGSVKDDDARERKGSKPAKVEDLEKWDIPSDKEEEVEKKEE